jgi:NitT/TauT family transport system permease protein
LIPSALPYVLAGLRLGMGRALVGITVAEMVVGHSGTGGLLMTYGRILAIDRLFVPILMLGFLSIILQKALTAFEGLVAPWRKAVRS